jgi:hypothetical protein
MIQEFNRRQALTGGLLVAAGALIVWITWAVLRAVLSAASVLTPYSEATLGKPAGFITLGLVALGVYRWWRNGDRYRVFPDQLFLAGVRRERGEEVPPFATGDEEETVSGFTELMSQVFLGAPRLICNGAARIQSRLPNYPDLEQRMQTLLERLRALQKWQPAMPYAEQAEEMGALLRCGLAEFSLSKMVVKAVSDKPLPAVREEDADEAPQVPDGALPATATAAFVSPGVSKIATTPQSIKPITKMAEPPPKAPPPVIERPPTGPSKQEKETDDGTPV